MSDTAEKITVVLGEYKGIRIPKMEATVSNEEIEEELKRAQQMAAKKTPKDGPAETGDEALIDFTGYIDGKAFPGGDGSWSSDPALLFRDLKNSFWEAKRETA